MLSCFDYWNEEERYALYIYHTVGLTHKHIKAQRVIESGAHTLLYRKNVQKEKVSVFVALDSKKYGEYGLIF